MTVATASARRHRTSRRHAVPWLLPAVVVVLVLTLYPTIYGIWLSFTGEDLSSTISKGFVGLANYRQVFADPGFIKALEVTAEFTLGALAVEMVVGLALAMLLTRDLPGQTVVRSGLICSMILSPVVVGTVWRLLLNPGLGPVNGLLNAVGLPDQAWLASPTAVIPALVMVDVWQWTPLVMLILLAGLQAISPEVYEAAQVDGASAWMTFRHIVLPLLVPAFGTALFIRFIDCFRTFDVIYAMTGGGPGNASENVNIYSYYQGLQDYHIGVASSAAVIMLLIVLVVCNLVARGFGARLWTSGG